MGLASITFHREINSSLAEVDSLSGELRALLKEINLHFIERTRQLSADSISGIVISLAYNSKAPSVKHW